ncbi:MAG: OmpA family protein [Pseudomonadota bacterium]
MGISRGAIALCAATAVVGFGAGAAIVLWEGEDTAGRDQAAVAAATAAVTPVAAEVTNAISDLDAQVQAALRQLEEVQEQAAQTAAAQQAEVAARNATADLLTVTPQRAEPASTAPAEPTDIAAMSQIFEAAQARQQNNQRCYDDLTSLAQQTRIYFPSGGLSADENGLSLARLMAKLSNQCPGFEIQIEGHSDASGNPVTNQRLSQERAEAVMNRLAASGLDMSAFTAVGFGDKKPSGLDGPQGAAFYDRRVEFSIIDNTRQASLSTNLSAGSGLRAGPRSACVRDLEQLAASARVFYASRAVTVALDEMRMAQQIAQRAATCDGAYLRLVGHFSDAVGDRETPREARMRALVLRSSLLASGVPEEKILVGAPSHSIAVPGQPGLPRSRVDFQIISD